MSKNIKKVITIPENLFKDLNELAKIKSITVSSLIRLAAAEYIERELKK